MSNNAINLNHFLIRVREGPEGEMAHFLLCEFLRDQPRGVCADYNYQAFRQRVEDTLSIRNDVALGIPNSQLPSIDSETNFWLTLLFIERGKYPFQEHPDWQVPVLPLEPVDRPRSLTPLAQGRDQWWLSSEVPSTASPASSGKSRLTIPAVASSTPKAAVPSSSAANPVSQVSSNNAEPEDEPKGDGPPEDNEPEEVSNTSTLEDHPVLAGVDAAYEGLDHADWAQVCRFWNCAANTKDLALPYMKSRVRNYQLAAVWFILTQGPRNHVAGAMLGDQPGLGKSLVAHCVLATFRLITVAMGEVTQEWSSRPTRPRHLPEQGQVPHDNCPNQARNRFGFECPCVKSGYSYKIAMMVPDYPSVIVCPPDLIGNWVNEFIKHVNIATGPAKDNLELSVYHPDWSNTARHHSKRAVLNTKAPRDEYCILHDNVNEFPGSWRRAPNNGSKYIVVVSSHLVDRLSKEYDIEEIWMGKDRRFKGKTYKDHSFAVSWMMFDEMQKYRGTRDNKTIPFKCLEQFRDSFRSGGPHPTMAVGITGDFLVEGVQLWRPFAEHFFETAEAMQWEPRNFGSITELAKLDAYENDWKYVVAFKQDPNREAGVNDRIGRLQDIFTTFVPATILARKYDTKFLGEVILQMPVDIIDIRCDLPGGTARSAIQQLSGQVKAWADVQFDAQNDRWTQGKQANQPVREVVERELLRAAAERGGVAGKTDAFLALQRSTSYPFLARLWLDNTIDKSHFLAENVNQFSGSVTRLLNNAAPRQDVLDALAKSPFWDYRDELEQHSPKFAILCQYIAEIQSLKGQVVASFVTFMLLYVRYPDIEFIYVHPSDRDSRAREKAARNIQAPCPDAGARNKVLVSTCSCMGTGHNLYRANYVVILDQPRSAAIQEQTFRRVKRGGQVQNTKLVQLYDGRSLPEAVLRIRSENRTALSAMSYQSNSIDWNYFVGGVGPTTGPGTTGASAAGPNSAGPSAAGPSGAGSGQ
ncbi:hypothetical protein SLS62_000551 [Diatrype stigma]|uniref:SNF2 N-terminal domain-containing protein n=1 Tax=Diatrype stigma TaxID=117547 RepID=A0AAN9YUK0_9PEZI